MFHFPAFPPHTLYIQVQVTRHEPSRVTPFGHPRITARLPAPRGLSQAPTSFIGSWCQGIHRMPLTTYTPTTRQPPNTTATNTTVLNDHPQNTKKDARVHCTVLKQQPAQPHTPHLPPHTTERQFAEGPTPRTTHPNPQMPVPSGPNSVPRPLNPTTTRVPHQPPTASRTNKPHQSQKPMPMSHPRAAPPPPTEDERPTHHTQPPPTTGNSQARGAP
jgi:hypothetical protein